MATRWTDEQRTDALEHYRAAGAAEASRRTGIPAGTIASWAYRTGLVTERAATQEATIAAAQRHWEERRLTIANDMGDVAALALEQARAELEAGRTRNAKDAATAMAILVDKAQLLTGAATQRVERHDLDSIDAEVSRLVAQLGLAPELATEPA